MDTYQPKRAAVFTGTLITHSTFKTIHGIARANCPGESTLRAGFTSAYFCPINAISNLRLYKKPAEIMTVTGQKRNNAGMSVKIFEFERGVTGSEGNLSGSSNPK